VIKVITGFFIAVIVSLFIGDTLPRFREKVNGNFQISFPKKNAKSI
jgi:hypothetical protein